ncbi:hypothetical protein [Membranihabitans marinus]|uniref:hypothetical protein n=1 Tax=Membranihabitans marinus TaxID=1227546 RepID=UPI001F2B0822|nr:hypothetical protein [Membranihabitans marinus]
MNTVFLLWIVAFIGLLLTIIPPFLVFYGAISLEDNYQWMAIGMVVYFGSRIIIRRIVVD